MGFLMLISPFLNLLLDFLCKFFIFLWMSAYFYGGSDPLTPYHFSDGGSEFWTLPPTRGVFRVFQVGGHSKMKVGGGHCPPLVGRHKKVGGTTKSKVGAGVYFSPGSGGAVGRHFS